MDGWSESKHRELKDWAKYLIAEQGTTGKLAQALLQSLTQLDKAFSRIDTLEGAISAEYYGNSRCC